MSQGTPILAIDHLRISVADLQDEVENYCALFGTVPRWQGTWHGAPSAVIDAGNLFLLLVESTGTQGLTQIVFQVDARERILRRARRVGLRCRESLDDPLAGLRAHADAAGPARESADSPRLVETLDRNDARGLSLGFVERGNDPHTVPGEVLGLDHVVIASSDAVATGFLLGARLGLDLRLDMQRGDWNSRLLFFRCNDLIVEVVQFIDQAEDVAADTDSYYGLSWRVADAGAAHKRLEDMGFDVSALRDGRKPGTQVFTVRSRTAGVATLVIQPARNGGPG